MLLDLLELLKDPLLGFAIAILSIIIGIFTNHFFYKKGKKEGDVAAEKYKNELEKAKKEIKELRINVYSANEKITHLTKTSEINESNTSDIKQILTISSKQFLGDDDILSQFELLLSQKRDNEAKNYFLATKDRIQDVGVRNYIEGLVKLKDGAYQEAIAHLQVCVSGLGELKQKSKILKLIARIHLQELNKPIDAIKELKTANSLTKNDLETQMLMGKCYLSLRKYDLADEKFDEALKIDDTDADTICLKALTKVNKEEFNEALKYADIALSHGAQLSYIYTLKGDIYRMKNDYDEAIKWFSEALILAPREEEIMQSLIDCYLAKEDWYAAEAVCHTFFNYNPTDTIVNGMYYNVLNITGRHKKVIELATRFGDIECTYANKFTIFNIGLAYLFDTQNEAARSKCEFILTHFPEDINALYLLSDCYRNGQNKDLGKAVYYLNKVVGISGRTIQTLTRFSVLFIERNEPESALAVIQEILELEPDNEAALANRKMVSNMILIK